MVEYKTINTLDYDDFIVGYSNCGVTTTKILNWEFEEKKDPTRTWVSNPINMLMMYIVIHSEEYGKCDDDFFAQYGELMQIIRQELKLNLKYQHGITR